MEYGYGVDAEQTKMHKETSQDCFVKQQSEMYGSQGSSAKR